jgi:uncharacterized protein (DUF1697 family)
MLTTYLALFRGINVGGKNKLPMKDLKTIFIAAGCEDVRTYIQSGNVIFRASSDVSGSLPGLIPAKVADDFGHRPPLILRTTGQLRDVVANNPFLAQGLPEDTLHVMFLADPPVPRRVDDLDPDRSRPDAFLVRGQEAYLHLPNGVADSKLTNVYFDSKLATISTGRNWRTVTRLLAMMEDPPGSVATDAGA